MARNRVDVDERTVAVDHAAGSFAYKVTSWLLVVDLAVRAKWPGLTTWNGYPVDIGAVLCAGCVTWSWFAWRNRIISRRYLRTLVAAMLVAVLVALAMIVVARVGFPG